ncbi:MAG: protein kinase family protein [Massilia sp.]|nr:protein kinase family protein [Massilia sp.]
MTSQTSIGPEQQHLEGRSVRDIVEYSPEQVNEVWCRKIFRQILQSLELQYAMHMSHRAITPDTIVFHDNGEPLLIPLDVTPEEAREAEDLNALARVVHYAITCELAPAGPLEGRVEGYSDSLINAVDRCMDPDPARRPQSIEALRDLLGIVPLGPPVGAAAASHMMPLFDDETTDTADDVPQHAADAAPTVAPLPGEADLPAFTQKGERVRRGISLNRRQRWAIAGGVGAIFVALALAMFAEMRDSGSFDHIVLTLPQRADAPQSQSAASAPALPAPYITDDPPSATATAPTAAPPAAAPAGVPAEVPATSVAETNPPPPAEGAPAQPAKDTHLPGVVVTPEGNLYRLKIQPWGVVYVDGVDRGVSPPVKRVTLAPGRHTIRITNPNFHDRVLDIDTASAGGQIAVDFNDAAR